MSNIEQLKANTEYAWNRLCAANKEADRLRHEWCLLRDELEVAESAAAEEAKKDRIHTMLVVAASMAFEQLEETIVGMEDGPAKDALCAASGACEDALKLARGEG